MDRPSSLLSLSRHLEQVLFERTDEDLKNMMEVYNGGSFSIRVYLFKRVESVDESAMKQAYESSTRIEVVEDHKYCKLHDEMQLSRNNFVNRQMEETTIEIDHATRLPPKHYY
ncbi:hypothetical protein Scep_023038 [Stephania cephalantha]|uniref:Uncharacterized protein n=1 Tax=Stephania cephalantha TaxID=152367 RepID=A0AAP0FJT3_9MAGN